MRRTLPFLPLALAAAFVVSGCGTERAGEQPADAAPAAAETTQVVEAAEVAAIPADFPLDAALLTGLDTDLTGPGPQAPGVLLDDLCPDLGWPADQQTGRLALRVTGPEYAEFRELVTFGSAEEASDVVAAVRDRVAACTPEDGKVMTPYETDAGTDSTTFSLTYEVGLGGTAFQLVRVGPAVLATSESGEFSPDSMLDYVPQLTAQNQHLTAQMECYWGSGCPAEPVTITPEGAGPLAMGTSVEDLRAIAPAAAVSLGGRSSCSRISWTSPSGVTVQGAAMEDGGLAYVAGQEGVQTAEGLAVGATLDELRAAYPDVEQADNGMWYVDRGDTDYQIGVTDGRVSDIGVIADSQLCVS